MRHFQRNHTIWIPSGEIQRLVVLHTTQTPRTCVRRLQEMAEEGILDRKLVKGHTHYKLKGVTVKAESPQNPTRAQILQDAKEMCEMFDNYSPNTVQV